MQNDDVVKTQLENGVRIISEKIPGVRSVSTGIWVGVGSRHENNGQEGTAHLIEHLMFRGTKKRSASDIATALDSVGGQLNAFTTKEFTCYYTKTLDEHFYLGLDVLTDMFFNSTFSEESIEKEKSVITEEIKMYENTPDDLIHDFFMQTVWPDHPLGKPILGTIESLENIQREDLLNFLKEKYIPERVVVVVVGNLNHEEVQSKVSELFINRQPYTNTTRLALPKRASGASTHLKRDIGQVQICLGTDGLSQKDERLYVLYILNNILGGGLSSRLVQSIREERGLAYSVFSYHSTFCDTGLFTFYAGTSPNKYYEVIDLFIKEIQQVVQYGITATELKRAKDQFKGNLLMGLENVSNRMSRLGRNELCLAKIISPTEIIKRVSSVTLDEVHELAHELFGENHFTLSTIGPLDQPLDLQAHLYI